MKPERTSMKPGFTLDPLPMNIPNIHYLASQESSRKKVLFFAEDATLAHVGRMIVLAGSLDKRKYDIAVACGNRYRHFVEAAGLRVVHAHSMSPEDFSTSLAKGTPLYTRERLQKYVADDLSLIARESPDLVVGDFRISLGITAELSNVPYVAVTNGCWSPYTTLKFPLPEHNAVKMLGTTVAGAVFPLVRPLIFKKHASAFNKMRKALGLHPFGSLHEVYTHATWTLYSDIPRLAPTSNLPENHAYLGPVIWEPEIELPDWWNHLPDDRPIVYLNIGSSGDSRIFDAVMKGLADMPVTVIAATAARDVTSSIPKNMHVAPYLPGMECARRASLVICNGGSGTIYQSLSHGVPVLGIPSNADQYLCMGTLAAEGAGRIIRSGKVTHELVQHSVENIFGLERFTQRANEISSEIDTYDSNRIFSLKVADWMEKHSCAKLQSAL